MMVRRLLALVFSLLIICSGCGLSPDQDRAQVEGASPATRVTPPAVSDGLRTVSQTATTTVPIAPTTSTPEEPAARVLHLVRIPDHLRDRTGEEPAGDHPEPATIENRATESSSPSSASAAATSPTTAPPETPPPPTTAPPIAPPSSAPAPPPTTTTLPPPPTTSPPVSTGSAAGQFASAINALRAEVGVGALSRNGDLDARAQSWAESMAASGVLSHSGIVHNLVSGGWSIAGENVGYGPSVDAVFAGLRASSGHYDNMVESRFTSLGVGVVVDANGVLWTAHLFAG